MGCKSPIFAELQWLWFIDGSQIHSFLAKSRIWSGMVMGPISKSQWHTPPPIPGWVSPPPPPPVLAQATQSNIIWFSPIRVTDWLNTVAWLKHNLVCSPPQSCWGGTLIDATKCFHSGEIFHRGFLIVSSSIPQCSHQLSMKIACKKDHMSLTVRWLFIAHTVH